MTTLPAKRPVGAIAFTALVLVAAMISFSRYRGAMDYYEQGILFACAAGLIWFGRFWPAMQRFLPLCGAIALAAIELYDRNLARGGSNFFLKYLLTSQSLVMWMCVLFFLATLMYWIGLLRRSASSLSIASGLTWAAATASLSSSLVRWYEGYLIGPDVGHIPVSNLYEVFVLFCLITALMYLYYEARFAARSMGAFVLLVISAAVGFILWYSFDRGAHEIQPLIPALQSWWMKIHVPANFVGYGAFAIAAMLGLAQLLVSRGILASRLPSYDTLGEVSYKAIAIGFLFFTIATILGAMWAADAWGGYWSWDPKETWALIVWLNYAAWLHVRLVKGWRGNVLAWWSVIGLLVTTFAFLGVNMFLSGLHSYGGL
ncbi:c-type cytochrome biogenesis protein CcsB [Jeongeupia chitinilytica]|uniref:C-type cytochrome biogenesis protein CcsB n=1 Tax=Jeongeupia chitinilytica TaxID=1041641 RepID=A0ABQ3H0Q0_9NEIS|nr:c-type cytochrome biogenesis protein CcsB [Jeongeupia chitinilytica]GHD61994.1 c-type cytochrome biogenesis protein CcsB [Jeongeupia chitinilytica]